jgi:1-aminocyclopropane-1-carboxylate deaminase/D-cysteine desulfhydrase-like pyridoxal-dependent ACC family enzyme
VAVAHPPAELVDAIATMLAIGTELAGLDRTRVGPVVMEGAELGAAYGRPTIASEATLQLLARSEGILVDPIYTAKALAGLVALARTGELNGKTVVFWHAGGTPSLFEPLDQPAEG